MSLINNYGPFLVTSTIAMPGNMNQNGDAFGGWILSMMDLASVMAMSKITSHKVVTRAVSDVSFDLPIALGDYIHFYAEIEHIGNTSAKLNILVYAENRKSGEKKAVTGKFTMVAVDENKKPVTLTNVNYPINSNAYKRRG